MRSTLLELGSVRLYSHPFMLSLGLLLAVLFWRSRRAAMGLRDDDQLGLLVCAVLLGAGLGGRLAFLAIYSAPGQFWRDAFSLQGRLSLLGELPGAVLAVIVACRLTGLELRRVADSLALAGPLWIAFGRLGCFLRGCCYGRPTELPWAVIFSDPHAGVPLELVGRPLHPAQLYELALDLLLFAWLWLGVRPRLDSGALPPGRGAAHFIAGYASIRFVMEFLRADTVSGLLGLSWGQWVSLLTVGIAGLWLRAPRLEPAR